MSFLNFIKEWLPSIGVIVGASWLFFKWLYEEFLRRQKESPSLDGKLSATIIPCEDGKLLVTVEGLWNNHSQFPNYLNINTSCIDVFRVEPDKLHENSVVVLKQNLGKAICHHVFLKAMVEKDYCLEPNTASTIINHFVLKPGVYAIRMELHGEHLGAYWWKELLVDVQAPKSKTHSVLD
jgi:hypothetical protein